MSAAAKQSQAKAASSKANAAAPTLSAPEREEEEGAGKLLAFQRDFGNQAVQRAGSACPNLAACPTGGACHECAQNDPLKRPGPAPAVEAQAVPEAAPTVEAGARDSVIPAVHAEAAAEAATPPTTPAFLVDDPATATDSTQMPREAFLAELRSQVTNAAEGELAGTGRTAADCPWIEHSFAYYRQRDARQLEEALRRYAPEANGARSAAEYLPAVVERVRRAVATWAASGELTGVPPEVAGRAAALMAAGTAPSSAGSVGSLLFKAREGGARAPRDLENLQERLGAGEGLDAPVRSRMETAFGASFGGVKVHRDANAAALSSEVNARAFALGDHVAFGAGEYRPGSVVGDALIAHELAHVVQQQGGGAGAGGGGSSDYGALEADADHSAAGAVASMWAGARDGVAGIAARTGPALRSGLRLQRCGGETSPPAPGSARATSPGTSAAPSCADPGNERSVDLQPVFFRTGPSDTSPTGQSWSRRFSESNTIWGKLGVAFTALTSVVLDDATSKTAGGSEAELIQVINTRTDAGIEVFMVDHDIAFGGGGATAGMGSADCKIVLSDGGSSDTLLAHELGHVLGLDHPPGGSDPDTIMKPSRSNSAENPRRNTIGNYNRITWPSPGSATCLNPDT